MLPPLLRADTVKRERLLGTLRAAVTGHPVTLVSAPAGYGKTTLVVSLRQLMPGAALAWVSLDGEENDPVRFVTTLAAALQRAVPAFTAAPWPRGPGALPAGSEQIRQAIAGLINEAVKLLPDPTVLVLDDLHLITEPLIYVALTYLIEHQPPQLRLVVSSRQDPPLPLARLAAHRQLAELRRAALEFTADEATQLLNEAMGLDLSAPDLTALLERTEGWAAGLCLLASSLGHIASAAGRSTFLTAMAQSDRYIFDFLAEEVLRVQEPEMRSFLLRTAVLTELTPAGCQAVTGRADAAAVLEEIYRRNLFVTAMGDAYRYHALFGEFLRRQLAREMPDQVAELHLRAAEAQEAPARRMVHYLGAAAWERAAQTLEEIAPDLLTRGLHDTLRGWYTRLPLSVREAHPLLSLLMGGSELARGNYQAARSLLIRAERGFAEAGKPMGESAAVSTLTTVFAALGDFDQVEALARKARSLPMPPLARMQVDMNCALAAALQGRWEAAAEALTAAVAVPLETGDPSAATILSFGLTPVLAALPGCLMQVERFCDFATGLFPGPDSPLEMAVCDVMTYLHLWRGQPEQAVAAGEAAEALRERQGAHPALGCAGAVYLAAAYSVQGNLEAAGACADRLLRRVDQSPEWQRPLVLFGAGRTYWLLGRRDEAAMAMDRLGAMPGSHGQPLTTILKASLAGLLALGERRYSEAERELARAADLERQAPGALAAGGAQLLLARLYLEQDRPALALGALREALAECRRRGMPGLPLVHGPIILPVLRLAATQGEKDAEVPRLLCLFGAARQGAVPAAPAPLPEPLTPREVEVLHLLMAGASNREIGAQLYIGAETVKTHVTRILRKLDATSRTQAIARAHDLGL